MTKIDELFLRVFEARAMSYPVIACLFTGEECPAESVPMPRNPAPEIGMILSDEFAALLSEAIALNPSIHDGAVMIGRKTCDSPYRVAGWSYRLFPPVAPISAECNRGSAYNSCFAMSFCDRIDAVYLISSSCVIKFQGGYIDTIK